MFWSGELFVGDVAVTVLVFVMEDLLSNLVGVLSTLQLLSGDLFLDVVQHLSNEWPGEWMGRQWKTHQ